MPGRVIDASALGALVFAEPDADSVEAVTTGSDLIAPPLLPFEVASICRKKCLAMPEHRGRLLKIVSRAGNMGIRYAEVDHTEATALALDLGITTYDAAYLWLAIENDADLVTLDLDLAAVAEKILAPDRVLPEDTETRVGWARPTGTFLLIPAPPATEGAPMPHRRDQAHHPPSTMRIWPVM